MIRKAIFAAITTLSLGVGGFAAGTDISKGSVAVVNFNDCMTQSKIGKEEQTAFESLRAQLTSLMQDTEKRIDEKTAEFNNCQDGLNPEGEDKMKAELHTLHEEMNRYQSQYYQILQQANMKLVQSVGSSIQEASEKVAKNKKLTMVMNKEACFFFTPTLDVTNLVIVEMDKAFEQKNPKVAENQTEEPSKTTKR